MVRADPKGRSPTDLQQKSKPNKEELAMTDIKKTGKDKGKAKAKAKKLQLRKETLSDLSLKRKAAAVKGGRPCPLGSCAYS